MTRLMTAAIIFGLLSLMPAAVANAAGTATVPVVVCDTGSGGGPVTPEPLPATTKVPAAGRGMEVYSVVGGFFQVLAPPSMSCQANVGADGTTFLTVSPSGTETTFSEGVAANLIPACFGCMLQLACPFFSEAATLNRKDMGIPCPSQPRGQTVIRISADAVAIYDPPGEEVPKSDDLVPENSAFPTNGVVMFYRAPTYEMKDGHRRFDGEYWTAMDSICVLPASQHRTCTALLNEFLATRGSITSR